MTETRQFTKEQFQDAMCTEYSDKQSSISEIVMNQMEHDLSQAIWGKSGDSENPSAELEISMKLGINRDFPITAKRIDYVDSRKLNMNQYHDCLAGKQLMPAENKLETNHGFFNIKNQCDKKQL